MTGMLSTRDIVAQYNAVMLDLWGPTGWRKAKVGDVSIEMCGSLSASAVLGVSVADWVRFRVKEFKIIDPADVHLKQVFNVAWMLKQSATAAAFAAQRRAAQQ